MMIRPAFEYEINWVNQCYDDVGFIHSNFDKEIIAVAEVRGQRAGIGRLVTIDAENAELGGMYVFESFRGQGVARKIVEFLLEQALPSRTVYCIPFSPLAPFYEQYGFRPCENKADIPQALLEKYAWCQQHYTQTTTLLYQTL